jgi:SAM-dependent methyltransferase
MTSQYSRGYEKSAHLYDIFDQKENIEFFLHYGLKTGEVLDIGAGTGRIAIPLAQKGIKVICVEPSPAMRSEFSKKLRSQSRASKNIKIIAADAQSFHVKHTFPVALLSGTFDHFLNDKERIASLTNIARHLKPQALLVFDVFLGLMKDSPLAPAGEYKRGSTAYRRFVGGNIISKNRKETILIFETYQSGRLRERIEERSLVGIIDYNNLHKLMKKTGFEVKHEFSNWNFTQYKKGDGLLIIEAQYASLR